MDQVQVNNDRFFPAAPYGAIWNCRHTFTWTVRATVRVIRDILDDMQDDQFNWQPYDMESDRIMAYAADFTPELWRSACPLIFYAIVEINHPERVLRQFGMRQNIPEMPDSRDMTLHKISRKARTGTDLGVQHIVHVSRWQRRRDLIVQRLPISNGRHTERGYWEWYNNIIRRFVSSSTDRRVESGYQPGDACMRDIVAEQIQSFRLSNQSRPTNVEGLNRLPDHYDVTLDNICQFVMHTNQNTATNENNPSTSHIQRRSNSRMSTSSTERDNVGVDIAGPSTAYTPQDYYVPQLSQQDDWFQSTPYMLSHAEYYSANVDLGLGLGVNQPYAPEYNISPIPFPSFSAYHDHVESSSAITPSQLHINDDDDEQNEPTQNMIDEQRRPRRQRNRRNCGTSGKYRCLAKSWRKQLSTPHFIKSHLTRKTHQENLVLFFPDGFIYSSSAVKDDTIWKTLPGLDQREWTQVVGSCDGLVFMLLADFEKFLVNPITLQMVKVPKSPLALKRKESFRMHGFGYDSSSDDYKVVTLSHYDTNNRHRSNDTFVDVYSVRKGVWKRVDSSPYDHVVPPLPWAIKPGSPSVIAAFNLAHEVFVEIPAPGGADVQMSVLNKLVVLGGCLCLINARENGPMDVWTMKEYGLRESWTKFTIDYEWDLVKPLCLIGDEEVVLVAQFHKLVVYNRREGTFRDMIVDGAPAVAMDGCAFMGSLVSPALLFPKSKD
ncbi:UNVERIFIED_CONTAM: F-box protein CPR1 [Sesamum latifolium]|uniref:F-box protein CPR1 n=1 Tax=Sesamum latifolium TaxID=2727402 RepID=A0AAW2XWR6_9LAMI